ncbi:MAG: AMP-binding protein [Thermodesulfobacteriota bacterium]|nr:AMP-binding protein [Thermodesulfobacteriota bacterium]
MEGVSVFKLLLNREILGLLLRRRTRKIIKSLRKGNIFLSGLDTYPDKEAIVFGEKRFTYKELKERINRLNNGLLSLGLKKGDHISILSGNSNMMIETILGPSFAGIMTTPINWHLKKDEIEYVINNSNSKLLVVEEQFLDKIIPIKSKIENVKSFLIIGDTIPDGMISYEKLLSDSSSADLEETVPGQGFMLYTSGTTGRPKGAHSLAIDNPANIEPGDIADFIWMMDNAMHSCGYYKTTNRHLVTGPIYHGGPLGFSAVTLFHCGTLFIMRKFDPKEALRLIEKERISTTFSSPIILKRLMDFPDKEKYDIRSMRAVLCAAAPCPVELKKKVVYFFGPVFYELYGSTEAGYNTRLQPKHYMQNPERIASVGEVAPGNKIKIVGEDGKEVPAGITGDLYISNAMVKYLEYYKDPEKTEGSFAELDGEKYFIEGEVAYFDEDGFCYIVDRKKDMIISGGVNIYPAEIEEVIHSHPCISDAAIIGVPDKEWGESVKAVIVLKDGKNVTSEEIIEYCNERLAGYKRPKSVDFVSELPRHPDGKLVKRLLREKYKSAQAFQ